MAKLGKWIGGGLGWAFGGPIGALLGYVIGSLIDNTQRIDLKTFNTSAGSNRTGAGDFGLSLLILSASVMQADGKVLKSELEYVKKYFEKQFGADDTREHMLVLRELLKQEVNVAQVCFQISRNMGVHARLQLVHFLFGISKADGHVHTSEVEMIERIAGYMNIQKADFNSIKAMFYKDANAAYRILEIEPAATDADVKKAYRRMALKFHPDKLGHLGGDFQHAAKEKFQRVNEAYETIKKERDLK